MSDIPPATGGTDQETFMARVRDALGQKTTSAPTPPLIDESLVRLCGPGDDRLALFETHAQQVGMNVQRVSDDGLVAAITGRLKEGGAKSVAVGIAEPSLAASVHDALKQCNITVYDWPNQPDVDGLFDVHAGITDVHAALAETGTLICCGDETHGRCLSLVPPVHLAIVRGGDVLPDMIDYWRSFSSGDDAAPASSISLITGPSKTADIEGELITGVHGPKEVWIYLVEEG